MGLPSVHVGEDGFVQYLEVQGVGRISVGEDDDFIGPLEVVRQAGLSSLRRALISHGGATSPPPRAFVHPETGDKILIPSDPGPYRARVRLVDVTAAKFAARHTYEFMPEPVSLVIREGGTLATQVQLAVEGEEKPNENDIDALLLPLLHRTGATVAGVDLEPEGVLEFRTGHVVSSADFWVINVYLAVPTHGRDAGFAIDLGNEALAILEAASGARLTPAAAESLVAGGYAHVLIGQSEGNWLECKSEPYPATDEGRFELAKDVAAFANSAAGGLIVIGLQTRSIDGRDIITAVRPSPGDSRASDRYRKLLDHHVFPRPLGMEIRAVRYSSGSLMTMSIPRQPPALQPFLVRGTFNGKKVLGSQLGVFFRRGDATVVMGVEEFHSLLVAGRAALGYTQPYGGSSEGGPAL